MSLYAAANIALAIDHFKGRNYARLSGLIENCRGVKDEDKNISELADELGVPVAAIISRDPIVQLAEEKNSTVVSAFPESNAAAAYHKLALKMVNAAQEADA